MLIFVLTPRVDYGPAILARLTLRVVSEAKVVADLMQYAPALRSNTTRKLQRPAIVCKLLQYLDDHRVGYELEELLIVLVHNLEVLEQSVRYANHLRRSHILLALSSRIHVFLDLLGWLEPKHHLLLVDHMADRGQVVGDVSAILVKFPRLAFILHDNVDLFSGFVFYLEAVYGFGHLTVTDCIFVVLHGLFSWAWL